MKNKIFLLTAWWMSSVAHHCMLWTDTGLGAVGHPKGIVVHCEKTHGNKWVRENDGQGKDYFVKGDVGR